MTQESRIEKNSFAAGEVGRAVRAHTELARYNAGVEACENMVVLAEGVLTRRPGTRLVLELKNEAQTGRLLPFRYDGTTAYMIVINGGAARFVMNGGFLGAPYELAVPYAEADLALLRAVNAGNIGYIAGGATGKRPQQLTRSGHTSWAIGDYATTHGPCEIQNLDTGKTIVASGTTGNVNLVGVGVNFAAGDIGTIWRLDESNLALMPGWQMNEAIAQPLELVPASVTVVGDMTNGANGFDNNTGTYAAKVGSTSCWLGRAISSRINQVVVQGEGFDGLVALAANPAIQVSLYARVGLPTHADDGTLLAQTTILDGPGASYTLSSNDQNTVFDYAWVKHLTAAAVNHTIAEIGFNRVALTPILRRYDGNVYEALSIGSAGVTPPTHSEGDAVLGVTWRYRHGPSGYVKLTGVTDADHAAATVLTRLPDSVTAQPTYRWFPPAWSGDRGWPDIVQLFGNRVFWSRDNAFWLTQPNTPASFELRTDELSALAEKLTQENGTLPDIRWALSSGTLVLGAADQEWVLRGPSLFDALTPANVRVVSDSDEGSAPQIAVKVEGGAIFIGRSRKRLHFVKLGKLIQELNPQEISAGARHILHRGIMRMAFQRDPHRILWMRDGADRLIGLTFMPEQKIEGWHRHPLGRGASGTTEYSDIGAVEEIEVIPTSDEGRSEVYFIVRRLINGQTRRFVEQLAPFFEPAEPDAPTAAGAWFVDCGLRLTGVNLTSVTAAHLKGATVRVFVDGGDQGLRVCHATTGAILVDPPGNDVLVGLPIVARVLDLPRNPQGRKGSTKGTMRGMPNAGLDVMFAAGGRLRAYDKTILNGGNWSKINPSGAAIAGQAVPLLSGHLTVALDAARGSETRLELELDNALPFTLLAWMPDQDIGDD